ncbi:FecR family protein [Prevotella sp. 10(H)]|uniref:FecR family protein n=1 Tax=Prevotella sp. 10(H) TaxID=1158294 RepID=UPI0004A6CBBA|nr:FecR family protein [Prevotella sp. 10(H)]
MKNENEKTAELLKKFMSENYTEDELLDLFEKANTNELDESLTALLPDSLDQVNADNTFTKREIRENFLELSRRIGLRNTIKYTLSQKILKYAAIIAIPLILGIAGTYFLTGDFNTEDTKLTFAVSKGNKGYMELADGSKVWLNSASKLLYGSYNPREVLLDGEAYFEIAKDLKNKFKVKTSFFDIVVYGTSFNVSTYESDDTIEIDLLEGSIGIVDNDKDLFKLKPGQTVIYDKQTRHYNILEKNMTDVSLWTKPELVIRDLNAEELFKKLSAWYRVDIDLKNSDPNNRLYNLVITNEPLDRILSLVGKLSPMEYNIEGKEVTIKYK